MGDIVVMEMIGEELLEMKRPASFVLSQISEEEVFDELFLNIILGNDKLRVIYISEEVNHVVDDYQKNSIWIGGIAYPKFISCRSRCSGYSPDNCHRLCINRST